jgi:RHS repeat-associated protein
LAFGRKSTLLTGLDGSVQESDDYYPYGEPITAGVQSLLKFTGKERDSESGLDNFGARYYGSSMGRFMTPDWAARPTTVPYAVFGDPQSLNLYVYVRNDPISQADADGHISQQAICLDASTHCTPAVLGKNKRRPKHKPQQNKATVIFGETSGLTAEVGKDGKPVRTASADPDLKKARENVADISTRNKGVYSRTPTAEELKNPQIRAAWEASQEAAAGSNGSLPGHYFFLRQDGIGKQRPSEAQGWGQGTPLIEYGPFVNAGGGDVPKGDRTYIDVYDK